MVDRIRNKPADFSAARRWFLKGAGATALMLMHAGELRALEGLAGLRWLEGLRKLQFSARNDDNEHLGIFAGSKKDARWIGTEEGTSRGIHVNAAEIVDSLLRHAKREDIRRGVVVDHTHTVSSTKILAQLSNLYDPANPRMGDVLDFIALPSARDGKNMGCDSLSFLLKMAGVAHGTVEEGVVADRCRWVLKKVRWDDVLKGQYAEASGLSEAQDSLFRKAKEILSEALLADPPRVRELFADELIPLREVAMTDRQRGDAIAHLILSGEIEPSNSQWDAIEKWSRVERLDEILTQFSAVDQEESVSIRRVELARQLLGGKLTFEQAVEEYRMELLKMGVALSWQAIE